MKEAWLLFTRIPKLLAPFLLFGVTGFLHNGVKYVYMNPLFGEMSRLLHEMEEHTDSSSADYAKLQEEAQHDATKILVISIAIALLTLTLAFAKQIVALFAASSTTNSGDRYSLAELLREVTKWHNLKPALIATAAVVVVSQLMYMALLGASFPSAMHVLGLLSVAFLYMGVLAVTMVEVGSTRKECSATVLVTLLLPTLLIPLCALGLLYLCTKQVMGLGPSLLSVYDLLQGVQDLLYLSAACVYCSYYQSKTIKETKEMAEPKSRYSTYAILIVLTFITLAAIYYITSQMLGAL
ncbi:unnamed protein product [Alopecurus aequalis]